MNQGIIAGRVFYNSQPIAGVVVGLAVIEGTSEMNVGRGVHGRPGNIRLYTTSGAPAVGTQLTSTTNADGAYAIYFKWDFLSSGGIPNDTRPFYRAFAQRFVGGNVPQLAGETITRRRGFIINSPRTVADLLGLNIPVEPEGAVGMGIDIASIWRMAGVNTLPSPLTGRTFMETQMFLGVWVFESN